MKSTMFLIIMVKENAGNNTNSFFQGIQSIYFLKSAFFPNMDISIILNVSSEVHLVFDVPAAVSKYSIVQTNSPPRHSTVVPVVSFCATGTTNKTRFAIGIQGSEAQFPLPTLTLKFPITSPKTHTKFP